MPEDPGKTPSAPHSLSEVVDRAIEASGKDGRTTLGSLADAMGPSSITAVLLLPALVVMTPLSGIPGLSSIGGLTIALVAAQIVAGRKQVWLPDWLRRRELPQGKLHDGLTFLCRPARAVDRHVKGRMRRLLHGPGRMVLGLLCMAAGAAMPFLELVPLTSSILATGVAVLALALLAEDGLLALAGITALAAGVGGVLWFVL